MKKRKLLVVLLGLLVVTASFADKDAPIVATITFDNRTAHPSAIKMYLFGSPMGCSTLPSLVAFTGNPGKTEPHAVNRVPLDKDQVEGLCPAGVCTAELYMNDDCHGPALARVILPLGGMTVITLTPNMSSSYSFAPMVDGIIMGCLDGTQEC